MSLVSELQRRNVFRVAAAYLVVGWLLTEVLTTILPALGAPDWTARAVILFFALGFVPALVLAWLFEWTPEGIKRDHEIATGDNAAGRRTFNYSVIASVVLLTTIIAVLGARPLGDQADDPSTPVSNASVAVLPFENMSSDKDNEYFSDGLTETLLHMLAQIPDLQVAARTSSFAFKGQNRNISEIAAALGVAHVLEGSVQRAGDRIRVTAQLIRASDGFHVWSKNYDKTVDDVFEIQDEIAHNVGSELSATLLGRVTIKAPTGIQTQNADAYDLYLQAAKARATFSFRGLQESENLLKGALAIDPDFLDAKAELAGNYLQQFETGLMTHDEALLEVNALVAQVLVAQPDHVRGQAIHLYVEAISSARAGDADAMPEAIDILEELLLLHPAEYQIRTLLSRLLRNVYRHDRALEIQQVALRDDPYNAQILYEIGTLHLALDDWDEARESLQKSLDIEPGQPNAYINLAKVSLHEGDGADFLQQHLQAMSVDPQDHELPGNVAAFLYRLGLVDEGDDFRDRVMAIAPNSDTAYRLDFLRAQAIGDEEASVAVARRAIEDDVSDRHFVFGSSVKHLLQVAVRNGTISEESDWLESKAPGILDVEAGTLPVKYRSAQFSALDAWYSVLPRDELLQRLETLLAIAKEFGVDPASKPQAQVGLMALRGENESAIELALAEVFSESVTSHLHWKRVYAHPKYAGVVADERVQHAMRRWEEEWSNLQAQVGSYLADLSAAS